MMVQNGRLLPKPNMVWGAIIQQSMIANASSTLFGQVSRSDVQATSSFFPRVSDAQITGSPTDFRSYRSVQVNGNGLHLSVIQNSLVNAQESTLSQMNNSRVSVNASVAQQPTIQIFKVVKLWLIHCWILMSVLNFVIDFQMLLMLMPLC